MGNKKRRLYLWISCAIAALLSSISVFLIPEIVDRAMGKSASVRLVTAAALPVTVLVLLCLAAFLRVQLKKGEKVNYGRALGRMFLTLLLFFLCALLLSLLSGLLAVLVYALCKEAYSLSQIKGIINVLSGALILVLLPFFTAVFWRAVCSGGFGASLAEGLRTGGKKYLPLFVTGILAFGAGQLLNMAFYAAPQTLAVEALKALLLAAAGTAALAVSGRICTE